MKKYELVPDDTIELVKNGSVTPFCKLFRIRSLIDFDDVKAGDLGGYIQSEKNLSQDGNAWVYGFAWVYGEATVTGDAKVRGEVTVSGNTKVSGDT